MKYSLVSVFVFSVLLSLGYFSFNFFSERIEETSQFKNKTESKLYPYEWSYLKKTWPYLDADPRAYIDALEQAHKLHKETTTQSYLKV